MPAQKWSQGTWWWFPHPRFRTLRTFAKYCPLIAAVLAPLSTLLDIPALAVRHPLLSVLPHRL
jgi:uncharacterized metal-binding protein